MAKRKPSKRRGSGGDPRKRDGRSSRSGEPDLLDGLRSALVDDHPLNLLAKASSMLHLTDERRRHPFEQPGDEEAQVPPRAELMEMFVDSGQPETQALALAMAHLQGDELLRTKVLRGVDRSVLPGWLGQLSQARAYGALETDDPLRDSVDVVLGIRIGHRDLTAIGLVDFNAGGALKDGFVIPTSLSEFEKIWAEADPENQTTTSELSVADARTRLQDAIEVGAMTWPPFESDSWPQARPFFEWGLRLCPSGGAGFQRPEPSEEEQDALLRDFLDSSYGTPFRGREARNLAEEVIYFGAGWTWGDPLLLSPTKIEILLLDWVPRKIVADFAFLARLPEVLAAFVRYGHERRGIQWSDTQATLAEITKLTPQYLEAVSAPRRTGAAALLEGMGALGPISDEEYFLGLVAQEVGGLDQLKELDDDPLPDEELRVEDLPSDIVERVRAVGRLCDSCCDALFGAGDAAHEHRTAVRRLLHDVAAGDPMIFRRRSKDETTAAAVCWLVGRANGTLGWYGGPQVKDMMAFFGLTGSPSQRAEPMRRAAGLPTDYYRMDLGSARYLTSGMRRQLIERRDRWLARASADRKP